MTVDGIDFTRSRTDYGKALQDSMVLNDLIPYLRHAVIVDTNIVLQNLAWMAKHDKDTILVQLAKSHKVVIWFPRSGVAEVEEHIGDVAKANPIIETRMIELWTQTIRLLLHVVPDLDMPAPEHLESQLQTRYPDDIPFLQTLFGLRPDYLVSRDKDLISLNITAEDPIQSWMDLRNYHTGQSIRVSLETMGLAFGLGATGATYGLFHAGKVLVNSIRKSPTWLKVLLRLALIIVFAIPKSRSWILNQAETGKTALGTAYQNNKEPIAQAIQTFIDTLEDAKAMEQRARDQLDSRQPVVHRPAQSAKDHALHVLMRSAEPLSADKLSRRIQQSGYHTRNERFASYLNRVLAEDPRFHRLADGRWALEDVEPDPIK